MSTVQKRLLGALAVLVLLGGMGRLLVVPALADRSAAREELSTAQAAEASAQDTLRAAQTAEQGVDANRTALAALARVVPSQPEAAALLDRLDLLARRSDVRLDALQLAGGADGAADDAATPTMGAGTPAGIQEVPVTLKLSGEFPRVVTLLRRLHGRGATLGGQRLLKLSQVKIAEDSEGSSGGRLQVDITAVAFVMPKGGADAGAATTTPTAGAAPDATSTATAPGGTG